MKHDDRETANKTGYKTKRNVKETNRQMIRQILGAVGVAYIISACSVKAGSGGAATPPVDAFGGKARIAGPAIEGTWASACISDFVSNRKWTMTFTGNKFTRDQQTFADAQCQTSTDKKDLSGVFIFSQVNTDGSYEINYAADVGSGWTEMLEEKLTLQNDTLYVSNFAIGDGAFVDTTTPMMRPGSAAPVTGTNPAPNPAPNQNPPPNPSSPVAPAATCQNYTGKYQMNDELFDITQNACASLTWLFESSDAETEGVTISYVADGVARDYSGTTMQVSFVKGVLTREYQYQGHDYVETWSFQGVPCQLQDPSGEQYLTRDVLVDGQVSDDLCTFYSKIQ